MVQTATTNNDAMAVKEVPATTTVPRGTTLVSIDFYFKDSASTDGYVTTNGGTTGGVTDIYLNLSDIRLYSLPDWQGSVVPFTATDVVAGNSSNSSNQDFWQNAQTGKYSAIQWDTPVISTRIIESYSHYFRPIT